MTRARLPGTFSRRDDQPAHQRPAPKSSSAITLAVAAAALICFGAWILLAIDPMPRTQALTMGPR